MGDPARLETTAEAATLAAMLRDPGFRAEMLALPADLFGSPVLRALRQAVETLAQRGEAIDAVTVGRAATEAGIAKAAAALAALPAPATHYLPLLHRARQERLALTIGRHLLQPDQDPAERLQQAAESAWAALGSGGVPTVSVAEAGRAAWVASQTGPAAWLQTGIGDLDTALRTLGPGELLTIGGRPGDGKSGLLAQIATMTAATGRGVLVASLEMSATAVGRRMLAQVADVDHAALVDGRLDSAERARVADALATFNAWPLTLADQPRLTPAQLRGLVLRARRERGCDVVCVDYLQLLAPPDHLNLKREYDRVTFVSDALRTLARETDTLVVAAAQLRRLDRERGTPRPTLEDLRNSGAIEQDSDAVLLIYHDRPGWADLGLAKHRNGPTGAVTVRWVGSRMRFDDAAELP